MKNLRYFLPVLFVIMTSAAMFNAEIPVSEISQNNNAFAFDLFQKINAKETGNIFFSPFSISTAMAMTYAGADANTATEIQAGMHFLENTPAFHYSYGAYLSTLKNNAKDNIQLRIANKLWGEKSYELQPNFVSINKEAYHSNLEPVNFIGAPEKSRGVINNWVANKTEDKIKDLIPAGAITIDTRLVLTNAIYFKGDWLYQFDKKKTKNLPFFITPKQRVEVPFMNFEGALSYFESKDYQMLRLPYTGDKQSMIVILPKSDDKMETVRKQINTNSFNRVMDAYGPLVHLKLPKFKMTIPLSLNEYLKDLGINEAFTFKANFSKMTPSNDLYISDVIHKAFIEIDEQGTEAAAATAVVMAIESTSAPKPPKPKVFTADHPFLIYIIDNDTKSILFMGKVMNPKVG